MITTPFVLCAALLASASAIPEEKPASTKTAKRDVPAAITRAVEILLARQESLEPEKPAREWPYEGVYRVAGEIPIGYRVGGTSICASALLEASGGKPEGEARAAVLRALEFVLDALDAPLMSAGFEGAYDVRGWGHAYALDFLLRLRRAELVPAERRVAVESWIDTLVATLQKTEIKERGGWNYSRGKKHDDCPPSAFMTAPTLLALFDARASGETVDADVVERALDALEVGRHENGAYMYGIDARDTKSDGVDAIEGSIGRSPVCELVLAAAGRGDEKRLRASIEAFFEHWQHLEDRRAKTGTHEGPFKIAPYYFYYAHRYAAAAIEMLPEKERRKQRVRLEEVLWRTRADDGAWNDRVFPRSSSFGTAMSVFALRASESAPSARWEAPKKGKSR